MTARISFARIITAQISSAQISSAQISFARISTAQHVLYICAAAKNICGIHVRQQKTYVVYMCGSKKHVPQFRLG
jgi:hypothetical protein